MIVLQAKNVWLVKLGENITKLIWGRKPKMTNSRNGFFPSQERVSEAAGRDAQGSRYVYMRLNGHGVAL